MLSTWLRHRRTITASLAAAASALLLSAVGAFAGHGDERPTHHESWAWNGTLAAGRTLEINGVNGSIEAVPGTGDKVEVTAEKTSRRDDPALVKIQVVQDSDGITICSVYPGWGNACEPGHYHSHVDNNDVQVEYKVRVPAGVQFKPHTVNGGISVHHLSGPVHANTVNGQCDIETSSSGDAQTVNGDVTASVGRLASDQKFDFTTVNGSIHLNLPDDLSAHVEGGTVNGDIQSDFPVTISGKWGPRNVSGTIGKGGARLKCTTVNGSISLHRAKAGSSS